MYLPFKAQYGLLWLLFAQAFRVSRSLKRPRTDFFALTAITLVHAGGSSVDHDDNAISNKAGITDYQEGSWFLHRVFRNSDVRGAL